MDDTLFNEIPENILLQRMAEMPIPVLTDPDVSDLEGKHVFALDEAIRYLSANPDDILYSINVFPSFRGVDIIILFVEEHVNSEKPLIWHHKESMKLFKNTPDDDHRFERPMNRFDMDTFQYLRFMRNTTDDPLLFGREPEQVLATIIGTDIPDPSTIKTGKQKVRPDPSTIKTGKQKVRFIRKVKDALMADQNSPIGCFLGDSVHTSDAVIPDNFSIAVEESNESVH
jgi:hypothetical protein